jgi:hypothetical protein
VGEGGGRRAAMSSMRRGRVRFSGGGGGEQRAGSRRVRSRGAWMQHGERAGAGRREKSGVSAWMEQQAGRDGAQDGSRERGLGAQAQLETGRDSHAMPRPSIRPRFLEKPPRHEGG